MSQCTSARMIQEADLIYRNPAPHLRSRQAYYPSVVRLPDGELLASFVIGEAMESLDAQLYLAHSSDGGRTWSEPRPLHQPMAHHTETGRLTCMGDGEVVALVSASERRDPNSGATNPANLGHVPTRLSLLRSRDSGRTWSDAEPVDPPLVGPTFELCSPIVELGDGRWLLPTSTWRGWDGSAPNGMKAVAFVSEDRGRSWPRYVDVMDGTASGVLFWEQKTVELDTDRLLAVAWAYDEAKRADLTNHYAIGSRDTLRFDRPQATPLRGQTPELLALGDGRALCVYRRTDQPGLWACVFEIDQAGRWRTLREQCIWRPALAPPSTDGAALVEGFRGLRAGAPCLRRLADGGVLLSFWAVEDGVANIRWVRLTVDG